ncbi:MAG: GNAT family N-acetyltransferase [Synoicihabitans sp.]
MTIRRAKIEDASSIAEIHVRSWQVGYRDILPAKLLSSLNPGEREEMWRERLEKDNVVFVAERAESKLIGFPSVGAPRDEDMPGATELKAIYLDPRFYGTGAGTALWQTVERNLSTDQVYLWVLADNPRGIAFYEKNGFCADGAKKTLAIGDQRLVEVRYRKNLWHQSKPSTPAGVDSLE